MWADLYRRKTPDTAQIFVISPPTKLAAGPTVTKPAINDKQDDIGTIVLDNRNVVRTHDIQQPGICVSP